MNPLESIDIRLKDLLSQREGIDREVTGLQEARKVLVPIYGKPLEPIPSIAGLHVAAFAKVSTDMNAIAERARELDVGVYPLRDYYFGGRTKPGLVFGYGECEIRQMFDGADCAPEAPSR